MLGQAALEVAIDGHAESRFRINTPRPLLIDRLFHGLKPVEAAERARLVFNICGTAQRAAVRAAFALPPIPNEPQAMLQESLRDHAITLAARWPEVIGQPADGAAIRAAGAHPIRQHAADLKCALLGEHGLPADYAGFMTWLDTTRTAPARMLAHVRDHLDHAWGRVSTSLWSGEQQGSHEGDTSNPESEFRIADTFPPTATTPERARETEIGLPARHANHPLMQAIEARHGHSLLWRLTARLVDLDACLNATSGTQPARTVCLLGDGVAAAPAARGAMIVAGTLVDGRVASFNRWSPTDAALHPAGLLTKALHTLTSVPMNLLPKVTAITLAAIDPCLAYRVIAATPARNTVAPTKARDTHEENAHVHSLRLLG